jgi:nucleotide-binding universal stress UspA family protein
MRTYRRILAFLDISADHKAVAKRATHLSRHYGADLALAAVVSYRPGFEGDHAPFMTPRQWQQATGEDMARRLEAAAEEAGAGGAEIIIGSGGEKETAAEIARSWRADLVLVGADALHGFDNVSHPAHDVLIVQTGKQSFAGRVIDALAAAL